MYVVTFICSPANGPLDPALIESIRNAWGGGDLVWLAIDEAAEFGVANPPSNATQVWQTCHDLGVDLVIQPQNNRRKKMLLADMDSTMIQQECIDELAAEAGVGEQVAAITARAMNGELDFEAAIDERVMLLKGLSHDVISQVLETRITLMPGGDVLLATMRGNGGYAALVSGGFTAFTSRVATLLGFDENRANTLEIADGSLTGRVVRPILGQDAKLEALDDITAKLGIHRDDVIAVGDGMNDLLMLANAGTGVALHGKPALQEQVDVRVNFGDLTALLFIQGYARSEFIL